MGCGSSKQTSTTNSKTTPVIPGYIQQPLTNLISTATQNSQNPFPYYDMSQTIAPLSEEEQAAQNLIKSQGANYQPAFDTALANTQGIASSALNGPSNEQIQNLMNPFLDQVLGRQNASADLTRQQQLQTAGAGAASKGAFGGSRQAVEEGQINKNSQQNLLNTQAQTEYDAFNNAQNQYNTDNSTALSANALAGNQAAQAQQGLGTYANQLNTIGQQNRALDQGLRTANYNQFEQAAQYPEQQTNYLANLLYPAAGIADGSQSNQTTTTSSPNSTLGNIVGAGLSLASLASGNPSGALGLGSLFGGSLASGVSNFFTPSITSAGGGSGAGGLLTNYIKANGGVIPGYATGGTVPAPNKYAYSNYANTTALNPVQSPARQAGYNPSYGAQATQNLIAQQAAQRTAAAKTPPAATTPAGAMPLQSFQNLLKAAPGYINVLQGANVFSNDGSLTSSNILNNLQSPAYTKSLYSDYIKNPGQYNIFSKGGGVGHITMNKLPSSAVMPSESGNLFVKAAPSAGAFLHNHRLPKFSAGQTDKLPTFKFAGGGNIPYVTTSDENRANYFQAMSAASRNKAKDGNLMQRFADGDMVDDGGDSLSLDDLISQFPTNSIPSTNNQNILDSLVNGSPAVTPNAGTSASNTESSPGINLALLSLGAGMLGTHGSFSDKLGAGEKSFVGTKEKQVLLDQQKQLLQAKLGGGTSAMGKMYSDLIAGGLTPTQALLQIRGLAKNGMQIDPNTGEVSNAAGMTNSLGDQSYAKGNQSTAGKLDATIAEGGKAANVVATGKNAADIAAASPKSEQAGQGKTLAALDTKIQTEGDNATQSLATLQAMNAARQNIYTGKGAYTAGTAAQLAAMLDKAGIITDPKAVEQARSIGDFDKYALVNISQGVKNLSNRATNLDLSTFQQAYPSRSSPKETLDDQISQLSGVQDFAATKQQYAQSWKDAHNGSLNGFDSKWNATMTPEANTLKYADPGTKQFLVQNLSKTAGGRVVLQRMQTALKNLQDPNLFLTGTPSQ